MRRFLDAAICRVFDLAPHQQIGGHSSIPEKLRWRTCTTSSRHDNTRPGRNWCRPSGKSAACRQARPATGSGDRPCIRSAPQRCSNWRMRRKSLYRNTSGCRKLLDVHLVPEVGPRVAPKNSPGVLPMFAWEAPALGALIKDCWPKQFGKCPGCDGRCA